jgi:MFS-type transporter involved in bile tolerance (Atg22 family)
MNKIKISRAVWVLSIVTMLAGVLAGFLWSTFNPSVTFAVSAIGAMVCVLYFRFGSFK